MNRKSPWVRTPLAALFAAFVLAVVTSCGALGSASDQEIFANATSSTSSDITADPADGALAAPSAAFDEPTSPEDEQQRPALRVDLGDGRGASGAAPSNGTSGRNGKQLPTTLSGLAAGAVVPEGNGVQGTATSTFTAATPTSSTATSTAAKTETSSTTTPTSTSTTATTGTTAPSGDVADETTSSTATPSGPTTSAPGVDQFPSSGVVRLDTGQAVTFQSQVGPGDIPVLVWLWAPGCSACKEDAPEVEQLAQRHQTRLLVASVAMTSSLDGAQTFVDTYRMNTPLTLVDTRYILSSYYNTPGVPFWVLHDTDGTELARGTAIDSRLDGLIQRAVDG